MLDVDVMRLSAHCLNTFCLSVSKFKAVDGQNTEHDLAWGMVFFD